MKGLSSNITISADNENVISQEVLLEERHTLSVSVDRDNGDVYLEFSSRQALYDFAKSLLQDSLYGHSGRKELYPLVASGKPLVVEGARLTENSSRVFIDYPKEK